MSNTISFRISGLAADLFTPLFPLSEDELSERKIRKVTADSRPGYPCRISLVDAEVGESLLLLPFEHHAVDSPFRASGPIYVRRDALAAAPEVNEIPEVARQRVMSIRAYDAAGWMIASDVAQGAELAPAIRRLLAEEGVAYLHLHNAKPGCYSCRVDRVA